MIVKLLGLIDLLAAVFIILLRFNIGGSIALVIAILLLIKSFIFLRSFVSIIDILSGVFLLLAIYGHYYFFTWLFALWLLQKAVVSIFS
jgi:hypothetical protein